MTTPEHPGMADNELSGASDKEEMSGAGGTLTALLPSLCDYKTSLLLHVTVYVNTQGRKQFPSSATTAQACCVGHSQLFCSGAILEASQHPPPPCQCLGQLPQNSLVQEQIQGIPLQLISRDFPPSRSELNGTKNIFYIHHEIQMGFQHAINASTESYPQCFPSGQWPCHLQQSFCFMPCCCPRSPGDCIHSSHKAPTWELPPPHSISESKVPSIPISMQLLSWRDGSTVEHQPCSARWKTFGTSTDDLSGRGKDKENVM